MNKLISLTSVLLLSTLSFAATMKCDVVAIRASDFKNNGAGTKYMTTASIDLSKPSRPDGHMFDTVVDLNGVKITVVLSKLGLSDAFEQFVIFKNGKEYFPFDAVAKDILYFAQRVDGKPGTAPGEWPFPGENKGDKFVAVERQGGTFAFTDAMVTILKNNGLFGKFLNSKVISSARLPDVYTVVNELSAKGQISDSELVGVGSYGNCYRK